MNEETKTALYKTITYRAICLTWTFVIAFLITGDAWEGLGWALLHQVVLTVFYFVHEKAWDEYLKSKKNSKKKFKLKKKIRKNKTGGE